MNVQKQLLAAVVVAGASMLGTTTAYAQDNRSTDQRLADIEAVLAPWQELMQGLSMGGSLRIRTEYRDPFSYSTGAAAGVSEDITLMRTRFHMNFDMGEHLETRIEFQDSRTWGDGSSFMSDSEQVDLSEGYITFKRMQDCSLLDCLPEDWDLSMRAGRQRLPDFGDQRVISSLDWSNVGNAFDGLHVVLDGDAFQADIIVAQLLEDSTASGSGHDNELTGLYVTTDRVPNTNIDVYAFLLHFGDDSIIGENAVAGDLDQRTFGARADHTIDLEDVGTVKATVEYVIQNGDSSDDDIDASAYAAEVTYQMPEDGALPWMPSVTIGTTFASGDGSGTDGDQETFMPIAPYGHAYQGHMDFFAWQNGTDTYLKVAASPCAGTTIHADYHMFSLDEEADAWYSASGSVIRPGAATADDEIGSEIDIYVKYGNERMKLWTGWSHFMDGDFVDDTGGGSSGDFFFFQIEVFFGAKDT